MRDPNEPIWDLTSSDLDREPLPERKWDEGEHEGCGIDSQRALERQAMNAKLEIARKALEEISGMVLSGETATKAARIAHAAFKELYGDDAQGSSDVPFMAQEILDFLNSIEGAGYGGMASFEIVRGYAKDLALPSTEGK